MVNFVQIPNLPSAIALNGTELFEGVQAGSSVKISAAQIAALGVGNVFGGAANQIVYQTAPNTTGFITAPTPAVLSSLQWNGAAFVWATGEPASSITIEGTTITSGTPNGLLYDHAGKIGNLATAANGVLVTDGSGVPSISSTLPSAVQGNITSLGTVTSGTWNGGIIAGTYGGTGVNNGARTITIGGNVAFSGAFGFTATLTGTTNVTFPTSGTLSTTTGTVTAVSVASANGFTGSSSGGATPALTLATSVTGLLKGNGTAISAAASGTDYAPATSGSSILYGNGAGGFSNVTVSTGLSFVGGTLTATGGSGTVTTVSVTTANGVSGSVANATTTPAITLTLGAITPTSVNGNTITSGSGTLTLGAGKTFTASNTLTLTGTDGSSVAFGTGGTVAYTNVATLSSLTSIGTIGTGVWQGTAVAAQYGGTGVNGAAAGNGKLLIGNSSGYTLANLTQGSGVTITNGAGTITIAASGGSWAQIATHTVSGTEGSISFTGISSSDIIIVINGLISDTGSNSSFTMQCSTDNGSSYGSSRDLSTTGISTGAAYGSVPVFGLNIGQISLVSPASYTATAFGSTSIKSSTSSNYI